VPQKKPPTHVMSVRLPEPDLRCLQALAAIFGRTPNALVVEALQAYIGHAVDSAEYVAAKEEYFRRAKEHEAVLEGERGKRRSPASLAVRR